MTLREWDAFFAGFVTAIIVIVGVIVAMETGGG